MRTFLALAPLLFLGACSSRNFVTGRPAEVDAAALCTVQGGGHTWPGGLDVPLLGKTTTDLSATDAMWSFFQAHPMP